MGQNLLATVIVRLWWLWLLLALKLAVEVATFVATYWWVILGGLIVLVSLPFIVPLLGFVRERLGTMNGSPRWSRSGRMSCRVCLPPAPVAPSRGGTLTTGQAATRLGRGCTVVRYMKRR